MNTRSTAIAGLAALACATTAWAGRPLASDDAGATDAGTCQVESWLQRADDGQERILAPACGLVPGLELGADYASPRASQAMRAAGGVAVKWAPESWRHGSRLGELSYGFKWASAYEQPMDAGWQRTGTSVLALATLSASDAWTAHANLGVARAAGGGASAALLNLALVWTPHAHGLLFAETQANDRRSTFGGTVHAVGARWWLQKDRLGLDLSTHREAGARAGAAWTLGFGWYGLAD